MGKPLLPQIEMFQAPPLTDAERIDAQIKAGRAKYYARQATKARAHGEVQQPRPAEPLLDRTAAETSAPVALLEEPSRDATRSRRKRDVRARTVSIKRMTKTELQLGKLLYPDDPDDAPKPRTRAECADVPRPCPYVSCHHHLYLDVSAKTGAIKLNFPDLEPWELPTDRSCALDVVEAKPDGETLEEVGAIMNLTRERVRQIEVKALAKAEAAKDLYFLRDFVTDVGPVGKRRLPVIQPEPEEADDEDGFQGEEQTETAAEFDAEEFASVALDAE